MNQLISLATSNMPNLAAAAGERAQTRFWEFFVSNIRNPHTRRARGRAAHEFLAWRERHGVASITEVRQIHVAGCIWTSALG